MLVTIIFPFFNNVFKSLLSSGCKISILTTTRWTCHNNVCKFHLHCVGQCTYQWFTKASFSKIGSFHNILQKNNGCFPILQSSKQQSNVKAEAFSEGSCRNDYHQSFGKKNGKNLCSNQQPPMSSSSSVQLRYPCRYIHVLTSHNSMYNVYNNSTDTLAFFQLLNYKKSLEHSLFEYVEGL